MDSSGSNDNQFIASVNVEDKSKSISGGPVNTSLPNLVCELASMHKEQSLTLEKQQHVIVDLKKHLAKTQHEVKVLDGEREQISRKHSSYETMKCKLESTCTYLLTCLNDVVNENFGLAGQIREVNGKFSFQERLCANYGTMMKQYTEKVDEGEATHYTYQRLTQQQSQLTQLQQEEARLFAEEDYAQVISGKLAGQLEQVTSSLQQRVNQQEQDINTKQEQVEKEKSKQSQLNQDIHVLHKRNGAQLLRMRRQLRQLQARNRQWSKEASELEHTVEQLRRTTSCV